MRLWILRPKDAIAGDNNPWVPWYDKCFGMIVRASYEADARKLAHDNSWDETREPYTPWLSSEYSSCRELEFEGGEEIIMQDNHSA